ncbi:hypothetical protein BS78_10G203800 [Paspalum vaginatum]|nr:hypothetical protein BS78_10G203800 [Paspalum vaginatum]
MDAPRGALNLLDTGARCPIPPPRCPWCRAQRKEPWCVDEPRCFALLPSRPRAPPVCVQRRAEETRGLGGLVDAAPGGGGAADSWTRCRPPGGKGAADSGRGARRRHRRGSGRRSSSSRAASRRSRSIQQQFPGRVDGQVLGEHLRLEAGLGDEVGARGLELVQVLLPGRHEHLHHVLDRRLLHHPGQLLLHAATKLFDYYC